MNETIWQVTTWVIPVLTAITLHEAAHGYVAERFGDDTARRLGRVSMNPLRHVDPFGTIILPALLMLSRAGFLFGYAKPVPVDFRKLNNPRRDMIFVAAAGPAINLVMALAAAFLYHGLGLFSPRVGAWLFANIGNAITLNVMLAVFNMLPIPPLDGGRVAVGLLPDALAYPLARLERVGIFVVLGALILLPMAGDAIGMDLDPVGDLLRAVVNTLVPLILTMAGWD
jgi:Zn-dependent protease